MIGIVEPYCSSSRKPRTVLRARRRWSATLSRCAIPRRRGNSPRGSWRVTVHGVDQADAFLRTRCALGNGNTISVLSTSGLTGLVKVARSTGRVPPSIRAMLTSDRLPQTIHRSCGLSLTTSHSAHKTAFCKATALRHRLTSETPSTYESFITEPRNTACIVFNSNRVELFRPRSGHPHRPRQLTLLSRKTLLSAGGPVDSLTATVASVNLHSPANAVSDVSPLTQELHDLLPFRTRCAQREFLFGFCSSPRIICSPTLSRPRGALTGWLRAQDSSRFRARPSSLAQRAPATHRNQRFLWTRDHRFPSPGELPNRPSILLIIRSAHCTADEITIVHSSRLIRPIAKRLGGRPRASL